MSLAAGENTQPAWRHAGTEMASENIINGIRNSETVINEAEMAVVVKQWPVNAEISIFCQ